jgi:signal peptidase II
MLPPRHRLALFLAVALATVGCDQVSKSAARACLRDGDSIALLDGNVTLTLAENSGGFPGLGSALPRATRSAIFTACVGLGLLLGLVWLLSAPRSGGLRLFAGALVLAGGAGNLIDRLVREGRVTDFLVLRVGPLRTGVVNLADLAITAGVLLFLAAPLTRRPAGSTLDPLA